MSPDVATDTFRFTIFNTHNHSQGFWAVRRSRRGLYTGLYEGINCARFSMAATAQMKVTSAQDRMQEESGELCASTENGRTS